jgi:hypothetical protein
MATNPMATSDWRNTGKKPDGSILNESFIVIERSGSYKVCPKPMD